MEGLEPTPSLNLQVAITSDGLDLSGSVIATRSGAISVVQTVVVLSDGSGHVFTLKEVYDPDTGASIAVGEGQSIEVTVSLTFS